MKTSSSRPSASVRFRKRIAQNPTFSIARPGVPRAVLARRVRFGHVRRQFQLARPIWFPLNYLLIQALRRYHRFYGDRLKVECPTGSGRWMTLDEVARELNARLTKLFRKDGSGRRPYQSSARASAGGPTDEPLLYYEYFDAETGRGLRGNSSNRLDFASGELLGKANGIMMTGGATIMVSISNEQREAIRESGRLPLEVADRETNQVFFLISSEQYRRARRIFEGVEDWTRRFTRSKTLN